MRKLKKSISIISLLFLLGCQSLDYSVGAAANYLSGLAPWLVRKPLEKLFADGSDDLYEDLANSRVKEKRQAKLRRALAAQCDPSISAPLSSSQEEGLRMISEAQERKKCLGCVPWGAVYSCEEMEKAEKESTVLGAYIQIFGDDAYYLFGKDSNLNKVCCEQSCDNKCDSMCPDSPIILDKTKNNHSTNIENLLPVTNHGEFYSRPEEHHTMSKPFFFRGVCNGHATVRRRISTLAMFSGRFRKPENMSSSQENEYYEKILEDLLSGKVREIPGYTDINSFLSRPHLAPMLREGVLSEWHQQGFRNPFQVESSLTQFSPSRSTFDSTMREIEQNLEVSGVSQITFGRDGGGGHTIEVYHMFEEMVQDPNDASKKVKAKIMCTIDSNNRTCRINLRNRYAPCVTGRLTSQRDSIFSTQTSGRNYSPTGVYCPADNRFIVHQDMSYEYEGDHQKTKVFGVDSQQYKNTKELISSLREYCIKSTKCNLKELQEEQRVQQAIIQESRIRSMDVINQATQSTMGL